MKIFIERTNTAKTISYKGTVKDLLKRLGINSVVVLVVRNNELVTEKDKLKNTDIVKILSVVSGG